MQNRATVLLATTVGLLLCHSISARAHIRPSVNENNRYLKLQVMGDRVRLAYIIYIGEVPGGQARQMLDRNRDGLVDETEADRYGKEIAKAVGDSLELTVDESPYSLSWSQIYVGLGSPETSAGSFSVDLIGWICLPSAKHRLTHSIVLRDHFVVPQPGETELYVEESPGVRVLRSTLGRDGRHSQLKFQWRGDPRYLSKLGFYLSFQVDPEQAIIASGDPCGAVRSEGSDSKGQSSSPLGLVVGGTVAVVAALLVMLWLLRRRTG